MAVQRINRYDDPRFRREVLVQHGAFLAEGRPWEIQITGRGFRRVLGFETPPGDYIAGFMEEAHRRGVLRVRDMKKLSHQDYTIQWDRFCDDFFARRMS